MTESKTKKPAAPKKPVATSAVKETPTPTAETKKAETKKVAVKKAPAKKVAAETAAPSAKTPVKKAKAAVKTTPDKLSAEKAPAKPVAAKEAPVKKAPAKKAPAKKAPAKTAAPKDTAVDVTAVKKPAAKKASTPKAATPEKKPAKAEAATPKAAKAKAVKETTAKETAIQEQPRPSVSGASIRYSAVQEPPEHLTLRVAGNRVVAFHYRLREIRRDGSVSPWLEESFGRQPLLYLHGHGNVVPGLEQAMDGKKAGDAFNITLAPEQAYGNRTSNEVLRIPIKHLHRAPDRKYLVPGVIVSVKTNQGIKNALVIKVGKFNVDLDTNHPYAGRTLQYQIEILGVRQATPEEVAHRHVHGPGGHQH